MHPIGYDEPAREFVRATRALPTSVTIALCAWFDTHSLLIEDVLVLQEWFQITIPYRNGKPTYETIH